MGITHVLNVARILLQGNQYDITTIGRRFKPFRIHHKNQEVKRSIRGTIVSPLNHRQIFFRYDQKNYSGLR